MEDWVLLHIIFTIVIFRLIIDLIRVLVWLFNYTTITVTEDTWHAIDFGNRNVLGLPGKKWNNIRTGDKILICCMGGNRLYRQVTSVRIYSDGLIPFIDEELRLGSVFYNMPKSENLKDEFINQTVELVKDISCASCVSCRDLHQKTKVEQREAGLQHIKSMGGIVAIQFTLL